MSCFIALMKKTNFLSVHVPALQSQQLLTLQHLWLSRVKYRVQVGFRCFELEARLGPMGDEALAMRSLEL